MIHTAHIHDCFRGTMQQKLEMMSLGMMFTQTGKNLFTDLTQRTPDLLIMVTPNYWPAFEQLVFKVQHRFPYQATVYLTHIAWPVQDQTSRLSVVSVGVMVTDEFEVALTPWTMICPVGPMVALATMPVGEMVMKLIHCADHEPCSCMPSVLMR